MIYKYAYNEEFRKYSFINQLDVDETITSCSVIIIDDITKIDVTPDMIVGIPSVIDGNHIFYKIKGGIEGKKYTRIFRIITSSGQKLQDNADIMVIK